MISIVIPIYNAKNHLHQLIECIKNQIYSDYEVLLVDNNSNDGSYKCLEKMIGDDKRFKLIKECKQGPNYARLAGFKEANGSYVYFCDADDIVNPNALNVLHRSMVENDSDIVVADYCEIDENNKVTKHCKGINYETNDTSNIFDIEKSLFIKMPLWNKLFKKEIINENFFVFTKIGEDMVVTLSAVANSSKMSYVNEEVYRYLVSDSGLSYNVTIGNVVGIVDTCKGMNQIFETNFNNCFKQQIEYIQFQHLLYRLLRSTLLTKEEQIKAREMLIPYILTLDKSNQYFANSLPFKMAYALLVNEKCYSLNKGILKFIFTNKTLNKVFKILDK